MVCHSPNARWSGWASARTILLETASHGERWVADLRMAPRTTPGQPFDGSLADGGLELPVWPSFLERLTLGFRRWARDRGTERLRQLAHIRVGEWASAGKPKAKRATCQPPKRLLAHLIGKVR